MNKLAFALPIYKNDHTEKTSDKKCHQWQSSATHRHGGWTGQEVNGYVREHTTCFLDASYLLVVVDERNAWIFRNTFYFEQHKLLCEKKVFFASPTIHTTKKVPYFCFPRMNGGRELHVWKCVGTKRHYFQPQQKRRTSTEKGKSLKNVASKMQLGTRLQRY